jgi:hypothetical protein
MFDAGVLQVRTGRNDLDGLASQVAIRDSGTRTKHLEARAKSLDLNVIASML